MNQNSRRSRGHVTGREWQDRAQTVLGVLLIGFLYIPIAAVVVLSFNSSPVPYVWEGFSFEWYAELFSNKQLLEALRVSVVVGVITATISVLCGVLASVALGTRGFRGGKLIIGALSLPLLIPELVLGVSLLSVFGSMDIKLGYFTLITGHLVVNLPYAVLIILGAHATRDVSLEEAAADLGCGRLGVMRRITLPTLAPALVASWLLTFTLSLSNIVVSTFTNGVGTTTLPLRVYSSLRTGLTPEINALGALLIGVTLVILILVGAGQLRRIVLGKDAGDAPTHTPNQ